MVAEAIAITPRLTSAHANGVAPARSDHNAAFRCLVIHQHEPARQRAREPVDTPGFVKAQRQRKKVEGLFAELKNQIGLRRQRLRRLKFVRVGSDRPSGLMPPQGLAWGQESCWREDRRTDVREAARDAAGLRKPIHSSHSTPNR